jgi:hypothetical protein
VARRRRGARLEGGARLDLVGTKPYRMAWPTKGKTWSIETQKGSAQGWREADSRHHGTGGGWRGGKTCVRLHNGKKGGRETIPPYMYMAIRRFGVSPAARKMIGSTRKEVAGLAELEWTRDRCPLKDVRAETRVVVRRRSSYNAPSSPGDGQARAWDSRFMQWRCCICTPNPSRGQPDGLTAVLECDRRCAPSYAACARSRR